MCYTDRLAVGPARRSGFVLIASLLILIVLTILALSMSRSFVVQQKMANNLQDKARAFQLAQSTLQFAESLLASQTQNMPRQASCSGTLPAATICGNAVTVNSPGSGTATVTTLSSSTTYNGMLPAIPISATGGSGTYYAYPGYYIQYLGLTGNSQLYLVTALAYGGNPNTVAVVQSTYQVSSGYNNLGGL